MKADPWKVPPLSITAFNLHPDFPIEKLIRFDLELSYSGNNPHELVQVNLQAHFQETEATPHQLRFQALTRAQALLREMADDLETQKQRYV